jgi:hypothetical protein
MARPTTVIHEGAVAAAGEQAAEQRAEQDGDEGAGLDQRIAADQLLVLQVLRQDRVLDRPEQRRVQAEQEQPGEQHGEAVQPEAGAADQHDGDFEQLDHARQRRLVVLVGELPGGGREEEEGQDEHARREVGQQLGLERGPGRRLEGQQHHHRVLQHVVVECAEELGDEQRGEAARAQQAGLVAHGGSLSDSGRSGGF